MDTSNIRFRDGDLEVRHSQGRWEIVKWVKTDDPKFVNGEFCYTLAAWNEDKEGLFLEFIGPRPFEEERVDPMKFWRIARLGDRQINNFWRYDKGWD